MMANVSSQPRRRLLSATHGDRALIARTLLVLLALWAGGLAWLVWRAGAATVVAGVSLGLLVLLAVAGGIGAALARPAARNLTMAYLAATVLALWGSELYLQATIDPLRTGARFAGVSAIDPRWAKGEIAGVPPDPDLRGKRQVLADLARAGVPSVPAVPSGLFLSRPLQIEGQMVLPLAGIANRRTVVCNEYGVWFTYDSDEFGFNNPPGTWSGEALRTAVIGDSFTHGACVPAGADLVSGLRAAGGTALNLGASMSGPLFMLARLKEFLPEVRPRHVVYALYEGNDFKELEQERGDAILMSYLAPGFRQNLASLRRQLDHALSDYIDVAAAAGDAPTALNRRTWWEAAGSMLLLRGLRHYFVSHAGPQTAPGCQGEPPYTAENLQLFQRVLAEAQRATAAWGGTFHLLLIPEWPRYLLPSQHGCYRARNAVLSTARDLQIPTLDLVPLLGTADYPMERMWTAPTTHFSPQGYAAAAQFLAAHLDRQQDAR